MARDGSGIYSAPAGTTATAGTTIESAKYNAFVNDLVTDANTARPIVAGGTGATTAAAARTALGVQASSPALTSIAALATAADKGIYTTAANTYATFDLTAAGRALLDDADAAAQRVTLGLGELATAADVSLAQLNAGVYASQAEAEAGTNDTKLMTPYLSKAMLIEQSRGLREVGEIALPNAQAQLVTGLTPGKQYRFVINRTRVNTTASRSFNVRASEDGGSTFRTNPISISVSLDWSGNILRGYLETGPRGNVETCFSAAASASLYYQPMQVLLFGSGTTPIWSSLCNAIEFSWSSGNFLAPSPAAPDDNRLFIFEVQ